MKVSLNGHSLPLFPTLDRGHVAVEIGGDFFLRIQPIFGRPLRWRCPRNCFAHTFLLVGLRLLQAPSTRIVTPAG
jgi:hypothetical protein